MSRYIQVGIEKQDLKKGFMAVSQVDRLEIRNCDRKDVKSGDRSLTYLSNISVGNYQLV